MSAEARALASIASINSHLAPAINRLTAATDANSALLTARLPAGGTATEATLLRIETLLTAIRDRLPAALDASGGLKVKEQP